MKTDLRVKPHATDAGRNVVELWRDGQFIGTVTGPTDHLRKKLHRFGFVTWIRLDDR